MGIFGIYWAGIVFLTVLFLAIFFLIVNWTMKQSIKVSETRVKKVISEVMDETPKVDMTIGNLMFGNKSL
jgi:hypothetical protein